MGVMDQHTFQDFNQTVIDDQSVLWDADDAWHSCIAHVGIPEVVACPIILGIYSQGNGMFLLFSVVWVLDTLDSFYSDFAYVRTPS